MPIDRKSILDRIRKLRAMTRAAGASESEAMFAAQRAADLIAEHNVGMTELELRRDASGCIDDSFAEFHNVIDWTRASPGLCKLFNVKIWYETKREDPLDLGQFTEIKYIHFYGFPEDVEAAMFLATVIREAFQTETDRYTRATKRGRDVRSFIAGMGDRVRERLIEMATPKVAAPPTGTDLVVLKNQLVAQQFQSWAHSRGLRLGSVSRAPAANQSAYAQGQTAGARANLHSRPTATLKIAGPRP